MKFETKIFQKGEVKFYQNPVLITTDILTLTKRTRFLCRKLQNFCGGHKNNIIFKIKISSQWGKASIIMTGIKILAENLKTFLYTSKLLPNVQNYFLKICPSATESKFW